MCNICKCEICKCEILDIEGRNVIKLKPFDFDKFLEDGNIVCFLEDGIEIMIDKIFISDGRPKEMLCKIIGDDEKFIKNSDEIFMEDK